MRADRIQRIQRGAINPLVATVADNPVMLRLDR
jgi:hypothetical protein